MTRDKQIHMTVGLKIRIVREALDMTQGELAKAVRLTRVQITNIEAGRSSTTIPRLLDIAEALGVKPARILP